MLSIEHPASTIIYSTTHYLTINPTLAARATCPKPHPNLRIHFTQKSKTRKSKIRAFSHH